ncbi:hypothetical protein AS86_6246 (plasmid) [Bacillus thuringiensis HD1002]|jgi:hypothetical protein|uniref:DUF7018 domain-containing protein n=5 Tax=Bacteria TaxID=2 RepID=A0AB33AQD7_BACTU|nr:hypothetical protein BF38_5654 [Bacillus thuringiensis]AJH02837.1 hypothetical protein AS86_6246 [Bacillus thuringiensis HD1002]RCX38858.1 hypothetical protein DEU45_10587 [Bacillus sp. AG102]TWE72633.1 hypothetical protein FHW38_105370 [Bacillus thuringiensis]TWG34519.1 hypothetical protein FHX98_6538 [Bacillus sp. AK8]
MSMKRKMLAVVLPLTLALGVGCSNGEDEKKKEEKANIEAEANKKALETVNKELDKLKEEKADLEKQTKEDKKIDKAKLKTVKEYQQEVDNKGLDFATEVQKVNPIIEKDQTLITNHQEVKEQFDKVKVVSKKLQDIKAPEQYEGLQTELKKSLIIYEKSIDKILEGVDELDENKVTTNINYMFEGLEMFGKAIDEIRALDEQNMSEVQ